MPRIPGIDPTEAEGAIKTVFDAHTKRFGAPLSPYLLYARSPVLFRGAQAMWTAVYALDKVDARLRTLLNRRVAFLNGCEF